MEGRTRERRERLRALLRAEYDVDALLVSDLANVRYLSGFSGSNAVLVVGRSAADDVLGTDGRYRDQAAHEAPDLPVLLDRDTLPYVVREATAAGAMVGVEAGVTVGDLGVVTDARRTAVVVPGAVQRLRRHKDAEEVELIARACAITAAALDRVRAELRPGLSEVAAARRLEQLFGELGADDRAFTTIVGSGPNSAIPHHQPGRRVLERGDLVVIDCGALVEGYHADMTRTFVVGEPAAWQVEMHAVVLAAQATATAGYVPGADLRTVDALARDVVAVAGRDEQFTHGLGHGLGLEIHEAPMVGPRATGTIDADMAITVEPGVYLPGRGGVRIEDTLVVTGTGPRVLTEAPRDLLPVG